MRSSGGINQGTPYVPSPLPYGDQLYFTGSNTAVLTSLDIKTGKVVIEPTRIPELSNIYASPAAAGGRIYFVGRDGVTTVLAHGPKLEVLATNKLDEPIDASPVLRRASNCCYAVRSICTVLRMR